MASSIWVESIDYGFEEAAQAFTRIRQCGRVARYAMKG